MPAQRDFVNPGTLPDTGNPDLNKWLTAVVINQNLICGLQIGKANYAVLKGDITTAPPNYNIDATSLATLAAAVTSLQNTVAALVNNMQN